MAEAFNTSKSKPEALKIVSVSTFSTDTKTRAWASIPSVTASILYEVKRTVWLKNLSIALKMASTDPWPLARNSSTSPSSLRRLTAAVIVSSALVVKRVVKLESFWIFHCCTGYKGADIGICDLVFLVCKRFELSKQWLDVFFCEIQSQLMQFSTKAWRPDNFPRGRLLLLTPTNSGVMIS